MIVQQRRVVPRREGEAVIDDDRLDGLVQRHRNRRVFEAPDLDHVIDEWVFATTKPLDLAAPLVPVLGLVRGDDQDVEARLVEAVVRRRPAEAHVPTAPAIPATDPRRDGIVPIGAGKQRASDLLREASETARVLSVEALLERAHELGPG